MTDHTPPLPRVGAPAPGAWPSPVTADVVVGASVGLGGPQVVGDRVWWAEARPHEGGRVQLVHRSLTGDDGAVDVLPDGYSARSRAHEYGGGAWWATPDAVVFTNAADQRLWRLDLDDAGVAAGDPVPITAEPDHPGADRHADARPIGDGTWWVCVRERHADTGHPTDELVAVRTITPGGQSTVAPDGQSTVAPGGQPVVLRNSADFVSNPRLSPDGQWVCWLEWDLPDMPWQSTTLWVAGVETGADGAPHLGDPTPVLGAGLIDGVGTADGVGDPVSLSQPGWLPDGRLAVVSDDDNWWNLWTFSTPGRPQPGAASQLTVVAGELAPPQWVFGQSTWGVDDNGIVVGVWRADGHDHIGVVAAGDDEVHWVHSGHLSVDGVSVSGTTVALIASSFTAEPEVTVIDTGELLAAAVAGTRAPMVVRRTPRNLGVDDSWWSVPEAITFATTDNKLAHALLYLPRNPDFAGDEQPARTDEGHTDARPDGLAGDLPPLMVLIHGGPTAAARCQLSMGIQFWTTRGWAVVDVNYRGSIGYGRRYRNQLHHAWGVADVADCIAVARWLADTGVVDGGRMVIRGGSAGGFTALSALATSDVFAAGVSAYGIADLEMLAAETHKFESGYNDWLLGSHADHPDRWADRSPINHVDRLTSPLLVLQGTDDAVVPPSQSELIVNALRQRGVPVAYLLFDGEGHGFRSATTLHRALEAEEQFLDRVLGIAGAIRGPDAGSGPGDRLQIHNLPPSD